ncbi:MAG: ATP-dependent zinc protease [Planctomycetales bacterium]|nr:ATP-dependent zinc protease [Planctomycetales bacterium]
MNNDVESRELSVVGWREYVALPMLGVKRIKAKIDTGARSSSLHAFDVEVFKRDGLDFVRFVILPTQRSDKRIVHAEAKLLEFRQIRSSSGETSDRPVIQTHLEFMGESWPIDLTLANRDSMGFRMLVGREAIRGHKLVDPGASYLGSRKK